MFSLYKDQEERYSLSVQKTLLEKTPWILKWAMTVFSLCLFTILFFLGYIRYPEKILLKIQIKSIQNKENYTVRILTTKGSINIKNKEKVRLFFRDKKINFHEYTVNGTLIKNKNDYNIYIDQNESHKIKDSVKIKIGRIIEIELLNHGLSILEKIFKTIMDDSKKSLTLK